MLEEGKLTVYRDCEPVSNTEYQKDSPPPPSVAIINAVAEAADVDPLELPPLYTYVDPGVLDELFGRDHGSKDAETILGLRIHTWNIFVHSDGRICVCDTTRPTAPEPVFESVTD